MLKHINNEWHGVGCSVSVKPYAHPQQLKVLKHLIYVWYGCGMQSESFYTLKHSKAAWFAHFIWLSFWPTLPNLRKRGNVCGGNRGSVQPYAHPQHNSWRCSNTLYINDMDVGCSLKGERFYILNQRVVSWFIQVHHLSFNQELSQIWGNVCGGNSVSVQPYAHPQQSKVIESHCVCMAWMWDAWKVLHPQSKHSGNVYTHS